MKYGNNDFPNDGMTEYRCVTCGKYFTDSEYKIEPDDGKYTHCYCCQSCYIIGASGERCDHF